VVFYGGEKKNFNETSLTAWKNKKEKNFPSNVRVGKKITNHTT